MADTKGKDLPNWEPLEGGCQAATSIRNEIKGLRLRLLEWCRGPDLYIAVPERNSGSRSLHDGREKGRWFDLHRPHQIILKQRLLCQQGSAQFAD